MTIVMEETFDRLPGDRATYSLNDGAGAVALASAAPFAAIDIETGSLASARRWDITAFSVGTADRAHVLDPASQRQAIIDVIDRAGTLVLHNAAYDVPILVKNGLMRLDHIDKVVDTVVTARLASPGETISKSLGSACERHLGGEYAALKSALEHGFSAVTGVRRKSTMFDLLDTSSPAFVAYSAFDTIMAARLFAASASAVVARLADSGPFPVTGDAEYLIRREQTINRMLLKRSSRGIEIDYDEIDRLKASLANDVAESSAILAGLGIDPDRSAIRVKSDVVDLLAASSLLPSNWPRLKNGEPTRDARWLSKIDHPAVDAVTTMAKAERFISDYADKFLAISRDDRIHPQVNVLAATTGRMSYASPPLQQYPASVRRMMRSEKPLTSLDWSSIEPVFIANAAGDDALLGEFEQGHDLYMPVADAAGVSRKDAKTILLAALYGQGIASLAPRLGVGEDSARDLQRRVMARMPRVAGLIDRIKTVVGSAGVVPTMSGRIIPVERDTRGFSPYKGYLGVNYYVQGSSYDLLAEALLRMHNEGLGDHLFAALHDEICCSTEVADDVARIMTTPPEVMVDHCGRVPVLRISRTDLGNVWREKS